MTPLSIALATIVGPDETTLSRLLDSVQAVVDDVVLVVNTGPLDDPLREAERRGARLFPFPWNDHFAQARNHALDQVRSDWVLALDADDSLLPGSGDELLRLPHFWTQSVLGGSHAGFSFLKEERDNQGQLILTDYTNIRLFPSTPRLRYRGRAHEEIDASGCASEESILLHEVRITHTGYDPALLPRKYDRAMRLLRLMQVEEPDNPWPLYYMARVESDLGHHAEAVRLARQLLEPEPHPVLTRGSAGDLFVGRLKKVIVQALRAGV